MCKCLIIENLHLMCKTEGHNVKYSINKGSYRKEQWRSIKTFEL